MAVARARIFGVASVVVAVGCSAAHAAPGTAAALLQAGNAADLAHDSARAYAFYLMAARSGLAEAEFNVAVMNDSGIGTGHDAVQAALWYARAASHGFARAFYDLGELATDGDGLPRNPALARAWFDAAGAQARARSAAGEDDVAAPPVPGLCDTQADARDVDGSVPVELVWRIGAMPIDTRFFVQVMRTDGGVPRPVAWTETPVTSLVVPVDATPGMYAWRVLASSASRGHYAASAWGTFRVP